MENKINIGCGPDIKEGWVNTDHLTADGVVYWDILENVIPNNWVEAFDFVLINHVLCTMRPSEATLVLDKALRMLKPGGTLQVIDMDMNKAITAFLYGRRDLFPVGGKTIDEQLLMHVSGYGTRLSLYTHTYLTDLLYEVGYSKAYAVDRSEHDLRPDESLIVEATK